MRIRLVLSSYKSEDMENLTFENLPGDVQLIIAKLERLEKLLNEKQPEKQGEDGDLDYPQIGMCDQNHKIKCIDVDLDEIIISVNISCNFSLFIIYPTYKCN